MGCVLNRTFVVSARSPARFTAWVDRAIRRLGAIYDPLKLTRRSCGVNAAWSFRSGMVIGHPRERRGWRAVSIPQQT